jgi:pimeloyl-ACP methyl ester carboxylesterase
MVQMACPALVDGMKTPDFMKPMRFRFVRWLAPKLPPSRKVNDDIMRQIGHGPSLEAGTLDSFSKWYLDLARYTNTMKNDMAMIGQVMAQTVPSSAGALPDATLGSISTPTHFIWGADDGFGGEELARRLVGTMPNASLEMLERSGHLPWLDFPERVGTRTVEFLRPARP